MNKLRKSTITKTFVVLMVALAIGYYFGDQFAQKKGFNGLVDLVATSTKNYPKSINARSERLSISIEKKQYEKLIALVAKAREEGVIPRKGNKFRKAVLEHNGTQHKIELRLKGKLTDHVKDEKWSFRVKVTDGSDIMGMRRFSLQHPGTRNYANEWVFHEMARKEGLIALRYDFVELELNDNDLGVYALEEHFGQELLLANNRVPGPVLRFDPGLYWQHRSNLMSDVNVVEEYAEFNSSNIDTYTENAIFSDSSLTDAFYKAQAKLEAFRSQRSPVDSVFDLMSLARYHALIDIVGGHHSLDWSDVKYYFDPTADRIEPVSYESFSVFPTRSLAGSYHFKGPDARVHDLHDALFNNEAFFRVYIQELRRMSDPEYLDDVFASIRPELDKKLAILYGEFPYKEFSNEQYYKNAEAVRAMLDTPQGIHAYFQGSDTSNGINRVHLRIGMVESLPIELVAIRTNEKEVLPLADLGISDAQCILPAKGRRAPIQIHDFSLKFPVDVEADLSNKKGWRVIYKILGDDRESKVTVLPYSYLPEVRKDTTGSETNELTSAMIMKLGSRSEWIIRAGKWDLKETIIVPEGVVLSAGPGVEISCAVTGGFEVYGRVLFYGDQEDPICIRSSGLNEVFDLKGSRRSVFKNVLLEQHSSSSIVELNNGTLELNRCRIVGDQGSSIVANRASIIGRSNIHVTKAGATAIELNASKLISLSDTRVGDGVFISATGAYIELKGFSADDSGMLLELYESEVILFDPTLPAGEKISASGNSKVELRNMANATEILDFNLAEEAILILNGRKVQQKDLVAK